MEKQQGDINNRTIGDTGRSEPGSFFRAFIEGIQPGRILLPADGDIENTMFAANLGWQVDVFDFCMNTRRKALEQAKRGRLKMDYFNDEIEFHELEEDMYDAIALIHVNLQGHNRPYIHRKLASLLKSGGFFLVESFIADEGNPDLKRDFTSLEIEILNKVEGQSPSLREMGTVLQMVARKH